ncbi:pancreatic progenitor cell differentiation and proliferation factor-like protein isoform X2 [Erpetoichthys calabaricus]|uniref:pancreatic progenitor cell differentiation and proliferation factor-like protein isoform X2 n=1 Tax=Erpetoichthys calabaricus TaxID=27687 RepID=UPI0010A08FAB|nr:pancreatic progenitor cell differentiation and proliferation factor-like protein isoform X2 [Erpetoichthys calabaricus]
MATVPSPGCLLARNQFYRNRLNSPSACHTRSSTQAINTQSGISLWIGATSQGLPAMLEKSHWISLLFRGAGGTPVVNRSPSVQESSGRNEGPKQAASTQKDV